MAVGIQVTLQESTRYAVTIVVTETLGLQAADSIQGIFQNWDAIPLHINDTLAIAVSQGAGEAPMVGMTELPAILVTMVATDTLGLGTSETALAGAVVAISASDSLRSVASEALPVIVVLDVVHLAVTDTVAIIAADGVSSLSVTASTSDMVVVQMSVVGFGEDVDIFAFTPQQFVQLSVADTCVVQVPTLPANTIAKAASDLCTIALTEPEAAQAEIAPFDSLRLAAAEAVSVNTGIASVQFVSAAEDLTVGCLEATPTVMKSFIEVTVTVTDAAGLPLAEAITLATDFVPLASADSLRVVTAEAAAAPVSLQAVADSCVVQAVEPTDAMGQPAVFEALVVQAADASPQIAGSFSFNVNDAIAAGLAEAAPTFPLAQTVATVEAVRVVAQEGGQLVGAAVQAAEALRCGLNDASLLLLKFLALTDPLGLPAADAASIFNNFIALAATDACAVQAGELIAFVQQSLTQLATSEGLALATDEAAVLFADTMAADSLLAQAEELVDLLKALAAADVLAWRVDAENANIINPQVVISSISLEDFSTSDVLEVTGGQPSQLTFFVTDELAGQLDDVALTESLALPEVADFMIETAYNQLAAPQSYRILETKFM